MIENRPIVSIIIGYILGIIMGLYCNISIVFLYFFILIIYSILRIKKKVNRKFKNNINKFKLISLRRYFRYLKLIIKKKVLIIIFISSIISNTVTLYNNLKYERFYSKYENIEVVATVTSNCIEKENTNRYIIRVESINGENEFRGINLYLYIKKNKNNKSYKNNTNDLEYGDKIKVIGKYEQPTIQRNYRGFNYRQYLKSLKIYGSIYSNNIEERDSRLNIKDIVLKNSNNSFLKIKNLIKSNFNKNIANIILSIMFGYKEEIDENMMSNFSESNMMYLLAVSGMHIGVIILGIKNTLERSIGKKENRIVTGIILIMYMLISGLSLSVIRAVIMAELVILSKLLNRRYDIWQSLSFASLIILIYNPFYILNPSFLFTFLGTLSMFIKPRWVKGKIKTACFMIVSMLPVLAVTFNKIPLFSILLSCIASILLAPIIYLAFLFIMFSKVLKFTILKMLINFLCNFFIKISEIGKDIPLNKTYIPTPSIIFIIIYYLVLLIIIYLKNNYNQKNLNTSQRRVRNLVSLFKYRLKQKKKSIISAFLMFLIIISFIKIIPKNLKIYFIDVGQGDSCLIVTPMKKTVLIDGGGSENDSYDVGKNTLLPYLLDRQITKIDYIIISHFDSDHVGGLFTVMEELKVGQVFISKQVEDSENYQKFNNLVKNKRINVFLINKGDKIQIEKDIYFDIIWPNERKIINKNVLNNNSIVCKLCYKNFSCIFTGDIEKIAEKEILQEYKNNLKGLKSDILKIAHHGSKTSSIQEFLEVVNCKVALIGVGENNKFGHPDEEVIERLQNMR